VGLVIKAGFHRAIPYTSTVKSITLGTLIQRKQRLRHWGKIRSEIFFCGFCPTLRQVGHVARMGKRRGAYSVLVGKPEGKGRLGKPRRRWEDNIKTDLQEV
jgi:hypothetical protein